MLKINDDFDDINNDNKKIVVKSCLEKMRRCGIHFAGNNVNHYHRRKRGISAYTYYQCKESSPASPATQPVP